METAVRWSSSSTVEEQRFLLIDVTGCSFRHCQVESYDGKDLKYETLSRNSKVPNFRAFDWSPHNEHIFAVGEWSGLVTVLRLDDEQTSPVSLPVRQQRHCNAVAFAKTGLLAVGLERVRADFCLNVWDVEHRLLIDTSPTSSPGRSSYEPVRKFASSEGITSIKFFHGQPDTLVTGVKGACIRLYDLRDHTGNPALQFLTTSVHNISIDLLDENYFASAGTQKDTTIQIWDRRYGAPSTAASLGSSTADNAHSGCVLEYKKAFEGSAQVVPPSIWSLRYCRGQSGYLGALSSNGEFKVFETRQAVSPESDGIYDQGSLVQNGQIPTEQQLRTKRVHHVESTADNTKLSRRESARIVAFDFTNLAGPRGMPSAITLRGNKSIEIYELKGLPPVFAMSSAGRLVSSRLNDRGRSRGAGTDSILTQAGLSFVQSALGDGSLNGAVHVETPDDRRKPAEAAKSKANHSADRIEPFSSRETHEHWFESRHSHQGSSIGAALAAMTDSRRRCVQGYLFDYETNMSIVADNPWLQEMWDWIGRAKRLAIDESLTVRGIDLSYLGVYNIWNVDLGPEKATRISGRSDNTDIVLYAIEAICRSLGLPNLTTVESSLPAHRRLCLHVCGFGLQGEELDMKVEDLADQGRKTEAAFLALLHGEQKQALLSLKAGSASGHRELFLALAGFIRGTTDDTWNEAIQDIASSQTDPFARAIFALVQTGSWQDILSENSLPLKFRVGIALMYLPDDDLTTYITTTTSDCIEHGDIEGIVLTGLSAKAVPLLQTYILKYHDLQTAILAISHTSPRYFASPLVDAWRIEYRNLLNTYRLFLHRVKFDTRATALSVPSGGGQQPALKPPPRQVSLRCNNCEQALDRNPDHASSTSAPAPASFTQGSIFADHKSGTVCPKCGKHLPRAEHTTI
ncbi:MAG: hypothetical protein Q9201_005850 [Fulgogasparrea decipioides]